MRVCTQCRRELDDEEFSLKKRGTEQRMSRCKKCRRDGYQGSAEQARVQRYQQTNREQVRQARRDWYARLRSEVIAAYGGKCVCCGEDFEPFLVLDHVNGGGNRERAQHKSGSGAWGRAKKAGFPPTYQLLCANCNQAKGAGKECPCRNR